MKESDVGCLQERGGEDRGKPVAMGSKQNKHRAEMKIVQDGRNKR
jgi:hypothetical protein